MTIALTPRQQRENLLPSLRKLDAALRGRLSLDERRRLGQLKLRVQRRITEIMAGERRAAPSFATQFIGTAKDMLPPHLYSALSNEAQRRAEAHEDDFVARQIASAGEGDVP